MGKEILVLNKKLKSIEHFFVCRLDHFGQLHCDGLRENTIQSKWRGEEEKKKRLCRQINQEAIKWHINNNKQHN